MSRPLDAVGVLRSLNPTLRPRLDHICVEVTRLRAAREELGPGEAAHNDRHNTAFMEQEAGEAAGKELEAAAPLAGPAPGEVAHVAAQRGGRRALKQEPAGPAEASAAAGLLAFCSLL